MNRAGASRRYRQHDLALLLAVSGLLALSGCARRGTNGNSEAVPGVIPAGGASTSTPSTTPPSGGTDSAPSAPPAPSSPPQPTQQPVGDTNTPDPWVDNVGEACTTSADCTPLGAQCLVQFAAASGPGATGTGLATPAPGGYCSADCSEDYECGPGGGCPGSSGGGSILGPVFGSLFGGVQCLKICTGDPECREGYACQQLDPSNPLGALDVRSYCQPGARPVDPSMPTVDAGTPDGTGDAGPADDAATGSDAGASEETTEPSDDPIPGDAGTDAG